jgi:exodeoxyribonuclease V alpha subunit
MSSIKEVFEAEITPHQVIYYNAQNDFGIFVVDLVNHDEEQLEGKHSIIITGNVPKLEINHIYVASLSETFHKKYGKQYKVENIYEKIPTTLDEQRDYLLTLLTENQVKNLLDAYPNEENLLDLIANDEIDIKKVHGVGEVTYQSLKDKVVNNMKYREALIELTRKFGLTPNLVKKLVDRYNSSDLLLKVIYENPYDLSEKVSGIGFKKADEISKIAGIREDSPFRIIACTKHVLREAQKNGNCYLTIENLINEMYGLLSLKKEQIREIFIEEISNHIDLYFDDKKIGFMHIYRAEEKIAEHLNELLQNSNETLIDNIEHKIEGIEIEQGFNFTDEQKDAIKFACKYNVLLITGKAGTGKTSVLKGILKVLLSDSDLRYETCAFSGKASQRINESTGYESKTIHRLLQVERGLNQFVHDRYYPLDTDIVILDEASMVNSTLFSSLIEAIPKHAKIIIMGDIAQLEAIGEGFAFGDLLASKKFPTVELTKVHRQALRSGVLKVANLIRVGKTFIKDEKTKYQKLGELQDLHFFPCQEQEKVLNRILSISKKYKGNIMDFQVITPTRKRGMLSANEINGHLQDIFNPITSSTKKVNLFGIEFREKDKIITKGNDYKKLVFNGTLGIIEYLDEKNRVAYIRFEDGTYHEYGFDDFQKLELAYALTIHRCQGSQFKFCVVGLDNTSWIMLSRELLYTALTRTIEHCFFVGQMTAIKKCIQTTNSTTRNTFLPYFLSKQNSFI